MHLFSSASVSTADQSKLVGLPLFIVLFFLKPKRTHQFEAEAHASAVDWRVANLQSAYVVREPWTALPEQLLMPLAYYIGYT